MSDLERFDDLLRAWQDGDATADELRALEAQLQADPSLRRRLVDAVLVESALYGRFAREQAPAAPARRWRALEAAAALLLFAVTTLAVGRLLLSEKRPAPVAELVVAVTAKGSAKDWDKSLERVTLGLAEAVDLALAATKGGTPIAAALEDEEGKAVYAVRIAKDGELREIEIDAASGKVLDDEPQGVDATRLAAAEGPGLLEGIATALARLPGRAVKAERELKGGVDVEVWSLGKLYDVKVDRKKEEGR